MLARIKKPLALAFLIGIAFLSNYYNHFGIVEAAAPDRALILHEDFERDSLAHLRLSGGGEYAISEEHARSGNQSLALQLQRTNDSGAFRAEIIPRMEQGFHKESYPYIGGEYWYSVSIRLAQDWEFELDRESIMQWHGAPDRILIEFDRNPPLAINVEGDRYTLDKRHDDQLRSSKNAAGVGSYNVDLQRIDIGSASEDRGRWVDWLIHVRWAAGESDQGFVEVYRDGVLAARLDGPNCYNDLRGGPYWKLGLYKWSWMESFPDDAPGATRRGMHLDDVRVGSFLADHETMRVETSPAASDPR